MKPLVTPFGSMLSLLYRRSSVRSRIWTVAGIGVSGALVAYLVRFFSLDDFVELARGVPVWVLALALGLYLTLNLFRALRFRLLLQEPRLPIRATLGVALYHNFLLRTLPFQTGEISYVVLARRYLGRRASEGVSSLVAARLYDLLLVVSGGVAGAIVAGASRFDHTVGVALLLVALLPLVALAIYFSDRLVRIPIRLAKRVSAVGPWRGWDKFKPLFDKVDEIPQQLRSFRRPALLWKTLVLSVLTYGVSISFSLVLLRAAGIDESVGILVLVITMVMIASWFPISFSGFGVIEGGWAVGLNVLAGVEPSVGIAVGFFMHGSQIAATVLTGMAGIVLLARSDLGGRPLASAAGSPK